MTRHSSKLETTLDLMVLSSEVNLCLISMRKLDETFNVEPVEVEVQKEDTNAARLKR